MAKTEVQFLPDNGLLVLAGSGVVALFILFSDCLTVPDDISQMSKFIFALRFQILSCLTLVFSIMRVGAVRYKNDAIDPLNVKPEGQKSMEPYTRRLQNTLEQLLINIPAQLVLSTFLGPRYLRIIPCLVLAFVTGRVLFFMGYPYKRGCGFMLSVFPSMAVYLADIIFLIIRGPQYQL